MIESDLTQRQRDALLCELSGMPQEEIARQLGTNRNTVYKIVHDARKALKRALEAQGYNEHTLFATGMKAQKRISVLKLTSEQIDGLMRLTGTTT